MASKKLKLPESSDVFEIARLGQTGRIPIEWVIDPPYLRLKDENVIKKFTRIKINYLAKVVELENQMKSLELQMLKDLGKALEG